LIQNLTHLRCYKKLFKLFNRFWYNLVIGWFSEWMERPAARGHIRSSSRFSRPGIRRMVFQLLSYSAMLSHSKKTAEGH
ncbi:MAG: hypothetical protein UDM11_03275, partial [Oscillospiraceae bacterium]|nr:hypothetical protein [Oscillospiraceae bacterium]